LGLWLKNTDIRSAGGAEEAVMATGPESTAVPSVVGLRPAFARQELLSLGYCVKIVEQAPTVALPDTVVAMLPPPGTQLALGSTVELTITTRFERSS
jgi:beta-lactam-binding protein with PASTA domain